MVNPMMSLLESHEEGYSQMGNEMDNVNAEQLLRLCWKSLLQSLDSGRYLVSHVGHTLA